ncbi:MULTISPECIES: TerB family tellurite resistance protein [unclassified Oleiphilus]|jgi:uncharacterized tellurite resistance protein B-like protein|nr:MULTISPECIES: TerB family tellurite resistance protein [unclassified Oleiphilus]KZY40407.1 hypothetical protein A3732_03735 [Oleiphilus sp. HI0050]KZY72738.1 hypothetical protein A3740_20485 [Oleiphilus sp. HI0068]KZY84844.1 hypothetical protein A3741_28880 [Oleiphilus sp. HI0069]KZY88110.1 hypothetical protein A3743_01530 [Oleiphilus sp. HI0072]KZZ19246.1 hypothetical protein A3749_21155 [Oleiphilus sp. HI0078]KZZ21554.1 hypothetical protein A3752_08705 [Oleiphilus sp. HI0081]KZZ32235.1 
MIQRLIAKITQSNQDQALSETDISTVATALLIEVINADHKQTESEWLVLQEHCASAFQLSISDTDALIREARELSRSATSLWEHTDLINKKFDSDSKYRLILAMWKIAYADSDIDRYEEHLIRKVSDLIYIPHTLFIKAKHEASNI